MLRAALLLIMLIAGCATSAAPVTVGTWLQPEGNGYFYFREDGTVGYNNPDIDWPHANFYVPDMRWEARGRNRIAITATYVWETDAPHECVVEVIVDRMSGPDGCFTLIRTRR